MSTNKTIRFLTQGVFCFISHFSFAVCFVDILVAAGHLHLHKRATFLASYHANLIIREILPKILQDVYISWGVTDTRQFCFVIFVLRKWREVTISLVRIKNGTLYVKRLIEIYLHVTNHMRWKSKGCRATKSPAHASLKLRAGVQRCRVTVLFP